MALRHRNIEPETINSRKLKCRICQTPTNGLTCGSLVCIAVLNTLLKKG